MRTVSGNAQLQDSFKAFRSRTFSRATGRIASSLRSGCLTLRFSSETARPNSILIYICIYMPAVRSNCRYRQSRRRGEDSWFNRASYSNVTTGNHAVFSADEILARDSG